MGQSHAAAPSNRRRQTTSATLSGIVNICCDDRILATSKPILRIACVAPEPATLNHTRGLSDSLS